MIAVAVPPPSSPLFPVSPLSPVSPELPLLPVLPVLPVFPELDGEPDLLGDPPFPWSEFSSAVVALSSAVAALSSWVSAATVFAFELHGSLPDFDLDLDFDFLLGLHDLLGVVGDGVGPALGLTVPEPLVPGPLDLVRLTNSGLDPPAGG
jgi:hypothetical protein